MPQNGEHLTVERRKRDSQDVTEGGSVRTGGLRTWKAVRRQGSRLSCWGSVPQENTEMTLCLMCLAVLCFMDLP